MQTWREKYTEQNKTFSDYCSSMVTRLHTTISIVPLSACCRGTYHWLALRHMDIP